MSGWGGVVLSGIAGAAEGVGEAGYADLVQKQKDAAQMKMQQQLATLNQQTHAVNAQTDISNIAPKAAAEESATAASAPAKRARDVAQFEAMTPATVDRARQEDEIKPKVLSSDQRLVDRDGNIIVDTQAKVMSEDEKALNDAKIAELRAQANHANAAAAAARDKPAKEGKEPPKPKWITDKDTGVTTEETTGIIRKVIDEEPAVKGSDGFLGIGAKPGKPGTPAHVQYFTPDGQPMSANDYYKVFSGATSDKKRDVASMPEKTSPTSTSSASESSKSGTASRMSHGLVVARRTNAAGQTQVKYEDGYVEIQ